MNYLPTIKQLEYLDAVARAGSFTKAAELCHVTQSTLSSGIASLENHLGQNLVERTGRKARLSALGVRVLDKGRLILAEARHITEMAQAASAPLSGPLRLGVIPTIAPFLVPPLLNLAAQKHPQLLLHLREGQSAKIVQELNDGALDMILLAFPYDMPGLASVPLFDEAFYLTYAKKKEKAYGISKEASMAQLDKIPLLLLEEGHCLRDHALTACKLQTPKNKGQFSATSLATLIQLVRQGFGATLLPEMCVCAGALPEELVSVAFEKKAVPRRTIGMAWRKYHPRHDEFEMFAQTLKSCQNSVKMAG